MSEHQPYKIILREELRNCWDMIREQRKPEPPFDPNEIPTTTLPGKPSRGGGGIRPDTRKPAEENGTITDTDGTRKPSTGVLVNDPPAWLIQFLESIGAWPLRDGQHIGVLYLANGTVIWRIVDENGVVQQQVVLWNGEIFGIPGDWRYAGSDGLTGQPLFLVEGTVNGWPSYITPLDGAWMEFGANAFPGINWSVRRFSNGEWRRLPEPGEPGYGNNPPTWNHSAWDDPYSGDIEVDDHGFPGDEAAGTWWDSLGGGTQLLLIMAVSAGLIAAGVGLGLWLTRGGHQDTESGGPPVIPDGGGNPGGGDGDGGGDGGGGPPGI